MNTNKRWSIFPIHNMDLWELYKKAQKQNWVAEEIDLSEDRFNELSEREKLYLKNLLAFFAVSDGIVIENLALNFLREIDIPEAQYFYIFQAAIEAVHAEMYGLLVDTYIQDPIEKDAMFNAVSKMRTVSDKASWAIKWIESPSFEDRLVAFACVEGLAFSSTFAGIFWFRSRNKMLGLGNANELISNDENSHYEFAVHFYHNYVKNKLDPARIREMVLECCRVEETFVEESLPDGLDGLTREQMIQYVRYTADTILINFGCQPEFNVQNPLAYMARIALGRRGNFFERRGNNDYTEVHIQGELFSEDF